MAQGCQEGKATPTMAEVICPKCGEVVEVFVSGGAVAEMAGRLTSEEKCPKCGYVFKEGAPLSDFRTA